MAMPEATAVRSWAVGPGGHDTRDEPVWSGPSLAAVPGDTVGGADEARRLRSFMVSPSPKYSGQLGARAGDAAGGLSVLQVLGLPQLSGAWVAAVAERLDREVVAAACVDPRDGTPVAPARLLVLEGSWAAVDEDELRRFVACCAEGGVAALAVPDAGPVPRVLVRACRERHLPLLVLPAEADAQGVVAAVQRTVGAQPAIRPDDRGCLAALFELLAGGGDVVGFANVLRDHVGGVVLIVGSDGAVLATSAPPGATSLVESLVDDAGRLRPAAVEGPAIDGSSSRRMVPITVGARTSGALVHVAPPGADAPGLLREAARLAAIAVGARRAVAAVEGRYRDDFLRGLLRGLPGEPAEMARRAEVLGWDLSHPMVAVVLATGEAADRNVWERTMAAACSVLARRWSRAPMAEIGGEFVALVPNEPRTRSAVDAAFDEVRRVPGLRDAQVHVGVGRRIDSVAGIPGGYDQARRAVQAGRKLRGAAGVTFFDDLGAFRLLSMVEDKHELVSFANETLGVLADPRTVEDMSLRETLRSLLDNNLNIAAAARETHFHYNTLRHRIQRLESMLGCFTSDAELRLGLAIALRITDHLGGTRERAS
jgi:purine catabolism regulator